MKDHTRHFTKADRFVYDLREYGETIGNETFLDPGTIVPGVDDDLGDQDRLLIGEARAGVVIRETPVRVTVEFFDNRYEINNRRRLAEHREFQH